MAEGMNGALLALGVVGAVALAGRVTRGSFARDWRPDARHLLALSEEEGEVDSGDLSDLLERIVEDRSVTGHPRSFTRRVLAAAKEDSYLDTGDALWAIQKALSGFTYDMGPINARLAAARFAAAGKPRGGGSRAIYGMGPDVAGRTLRLGFGKPRSNAGEALNDYRWHPQRALAQLAALSKGRKGKGGSRAFIIDDPEYTHYILHTPSMKIASGWSYAEDAKEALDDMGPAKAHCKVYTRKYLRDNGRDPRHNGSWASRGQF